MSYQTIDRLTVRSVARAFLSSRVGGEAPKIKRFDPGVDVKRADKKVGIVAAGLRSGEFVVIRRS